MGEQLLQGKTALITGGARGIGRAIAEALAANGCRVILTSRGLQQAQQAAAEIASAHGSHGEAEQLIGAQCDVTLQASVERLFEEIGRTAPQLDILVNNAGFAGPSAPVGKINADNFRQVIDINLTGLYLVTQTALPFLHHGSTIVNILSVAARDPFKGMAAYAAAKGGALAFTNVLREELRPRGVRVSNIMPGATATDIWEQIWPQAPKAKMAPPSAIANAVLGLVTQPDHVSVDELRITPAAGAL